jgi:hypothetical protein
MTASFDFDRLLESVLESGGPQTMPETVVEAGLTQARTVRQRRPIVPVLDRRAWPGDRISLGLRPSPIPARWTRVLILAMIATALVVLGIVGSALRREDPTPKLLETTFDPQFEYAMPAGPDMQVSGNRLPEMVAWFRGPDTWPNSSIETTGGQPAPWQVRGVAVGSGDGAWSHGDDGRFMLRTAPADFLADLRDTAGVRITAIDETTLDGRPALAATLPGYGGTDIHVNGRMTGRGGGPYLRVQLPSRLTVADVDGSTVFVLVWARTPTELETWRPVADSFVSSIHFLPE